MVYRFLYRFFTGAVRTYLATFVGGGESPGALENEISKPLFSEAQLALIFVSFLFVIGIVIAIPLYNTNKEKRDVAAREEPKTLPNCATTEFHTNTNEKGKEKMKCTNCGREHLQCINTLHTEKKDATIFNLFSVLGLFGAFISAILIISVLSSNDAAQMLFLGELFGFFFNSLLFAGGCFVARMFLPYDVSNVVYVVCPDCGHIEPLAVCKRRQSAPVPPPAQPSDAPTNVQ